MTGSFEAFFLALAAFFATHSLPAVRPLRRRAVRAIGERAYIGLYSLVSLAALAWVVAAALAAPYLPLWQYRSWTVWVPTVLMAPACLLLVCGATSPNPLSIGPRRGYDPRDPGIVAVTRHPVLWGFALWAGGQLFPNGDLAAVIMFAMFLSFALLGMPLIDAKRRRELGVEPWQRLAADTSLVPFAAAIAGRTQIRWRAIGAPRLGASAALYALLVAGHQWLFGVWPLPSL